MRNVCTGLELSEGTIRKVTVFTDRVTLHDG